jgi:hypothetical protein
MVPPNATQDYYRWMWGDAGSDLEGHALAESNPLRWSDWLSVEACISDLSSYDTQANRARQVELLRADHQDVPARFDTLGQAISYLSQYTTTPAPTIVKEKRIVIKEASAVTTRADVFAILYFPTSRDELAMALGAVFTCIALVTCACATVCCRACCRRKTKEEHGTWSSARDVSEKTALCGGASQDSSDHVAFHETELRSLLTEVEEAEPSLMCLPDRPEAAQRAEAGREVERVLAAKDMHDILGSGSAAQQRGAYRRLVRLFHPDKGLVAGDRAALALRRVVECYQAQKLSDTSRA